MAHQDNDLDYFLKEMRGVVPLKQAPKVDLQPGKAADAESLETRRNAAQAAVKKDNNFLSDEFVELLGPFDPIEYKKDGIQDGVYKRLKQGRYPVDAALNLYKKPVEVCRKEVFDFIEDCYKNDIRVALITVGKGSTPTSLPYVVKSYLARWIPEFPQVIAAHSADKAHGGLTGVYIMLKKSERQKAINRDRHLKQGRQPRQG